MRITKGESARRIKGKKKRKQLCGSERNGQSACVLGLENIAREGRRETKERAEGVGPRIKGA